MGVSKKVITYLSSTNIIDKEDKNRIQKFDEWIKITINTCSGIAFISWKLE